jgi:3-hydroxybutyrate dehydrogenase
VAQSERLRAVLETRYHAADLSHMTKRGWGRIINIASAHGLIASANRAAYWVLTPLVQKQIDDLARREKLTGDEAKRRLLAEKQPSGKFATPAEIGGLAVFLCSDAASQIRGASLSIDGGWTAQ